MKIKRYFDLDQFLKPNKALIIFGPRQAGKTTLMMDFLTESNSKFKLAIGDDIIVQQVLNSQSLDVLKEFVAGYEILAVDEAQKIKNIGLGLKLLVDHVPGLKIIATGSSSFELAGQVGEPLTGRKLTITLYPVSQLELSTIYNRYELQEKLEEFLVFGTYPEVITAENKNEKTRLLNEITGSYLLKDILEFERVKNSKILLDLLKLLAFQIGNEVSLSELAKQLGIDHKTVARYLDLFEKSFVIYSLNGYSSNLRKEISKKSKYYFYDTGIRNTLISNFNPLTMRNDTGMLWENFLFMERLKKKAYQFIYCNNYFWRTWDKKEVDLVEEREGKLFGYEFKWGSKKIKAGPKLWKQTYTESEFELIDRENYLDFIL